MPTNKTPQEKYEEELKQEEHDHLHKPTMLPIREKIIPIKGMVAKMPITTPQTISIKA